MDSRSHIHEELFDASADEMFDLLITPSAIRGWWGASAKRIIDLREDGIWTAAWSDEDVFGLHLDGDVGRIRPSPEIGDEIWKVLCEDPGPYRSNLPRMLMTVFRVEPSGDGWVEK